MTYEETPVRKTTVKSKTANQDIARLGTGDIIWHVIKRHKFGLVSSWAVAITVLYLAPFVPDMIWSLF